MATALSQLHLARAATTTSTSTKLHNLSKTTTNILRCRTPTPILRAIGLPNLRISATLHKNSSQQQSEPEEKNAWPMLVGAAAAGSLGAAWPAQALIPEPIEEMMRFSPEAWVNIYITTAVILPLYFVVIPLVTYNYLRLRWYNRSTLETYFQFMLVFVFFPGMLLLAPFINFRRLPPNGAQEPWE